MHNISNSPPRAPPIKYNAPLGTRWAKEKAAAGGATAFDLPTDPVAIGPWILGECVGKGASGRVKIAKHRHTGQLAAVKILPIAPLVNSRTSLATQQAKSDKQRLGIDREIIMMKLMNHPNIMRIYDVYENDKELFLVLEYVEGGELFDFLVNRGRLPAAEALIYFRQIVYGLNYAHTFSIIHRDLKPENILISSLSPPSIKIADWGMAAFAPPALHLETSCGSPHYASPEIVNGEKYQGHATDIWSCGVILFALLTGRLPFDDKNVRTLLSKVKTGKYDMPAWIDPLAKDLLKKMLVVNVQDRITIPDILQHPWLSSQPSVSFSATDGKTYSLLPPPLPPSPTYLASPLASPEMIDSELFSALKIIWGRHVDPQGESIRRDLCSPSGQGVHTKAFYFLLGKYREETLKIDADNAIKDVVMNDATSDLATRCLTPADQLTDGLRRYQVSSSYISPSSERTTSETTMLTEEHGQSASVSRPNNIIIGPPPHPIARRRTITDGAFEAKSDPNPPAKSDQRKAQLLALQIDRSSSNFTRPKSSLGEMARSGFSRPQPRRGHTSVMLHSRKDIEPPSSAPVTTLGFSHHLHQLQARTPSTAAFLESRRSGSHASSLPINVMARRTEISPRPSTILQNDQMEISPQSRDVIDRAGPMPLTLEKLEVIPPLNHKPDDVRKTMDSLAQKANASVQGVTQAPSLPMVPTFVPGSADTAGSRLSKSFRSKVKIDKENQGLEEGWSRVRYGSVAPGSIGLGVGGGLGNRDVGNNSPSKARKEKEKKFRPPPLDLPSLNPRRSGFALLGSPINLSTPVHTPSSANRILASPVVGEFKGWFSNLFGWKNSSHSGGLLYSASDFQTTRLSLIHALDGLGVLVTNSHTSTNHSAPLDSSNVLYCRIDQPAVDPSSGTQLKAVRFKVEIRGTGSVNEPQAAMSPVGNDNPYFMSAPPTTADALSVSSPPTPITPFSAGGGTPSMISSSRPRITLLLGGRSSSYGTPLPSPALPGSARWDSTFPAGCLCAVALVHEKGSTSTFRLVWKKVKEEISGPYGAYPCFSPAIPNTPHEGHRSMVV